MNFYLATLILGLLPPTRLFGLKRTLLRWLGIQVGQGSRVCGHVAFFGGGRVRIGEQTWVGLGCRFYTSPGSLIEIGDRCDIGPETCFINGSHQIGGAERRAGPNCAADIRVGDGTWLGVRVMVHGGAQIGASCFAGAGAMVLPGAYPSSSRLLGSPAKATPLAEVVQGKPL